MTEIGSSAAVGTEPTTATVPNGIGTRSDVTAGVAPPAAVTGFDAVVALASAVAAATAVGRLGPVLPPAAAIALVIVQYAVIAAAAVSALTPGHRVPGVASTTLLLDRAGPLLRALRPRRRDLVPAVQAWLVAVGATALLTSLLTRLGVPVASNNAAGSFAAPDHPAGLLLAVLLLGVLFVAVVPVVEELLFRGVLLRALGRHVTAVAALAGQALPFAAFHADTRYGLGNVGLVVALVPSGLAFGVLAQRRGLAAAVVAHALHNALALAAVLLA